MAENITDLTQQVESALMKDPRTKDSAIDVIDKNGIITLTGKVPSLKISQAVEELVSKQAGVVDVINQLEYEVGKQSSGPSETPPVIPPRAPSA